MGLSVSALSCPAEPAAFIIGPTGGTPLTEALCYVIRNLFGPARKERSLLWLPMAVRTTLKQHGKWRLLRISGSKHMGSESRQRDGAGDSSIKIHMDELPQNFIRLTKEFLLRGRHFVKPTPKKILFKWTEMLRWVDNKGNAEVWEMKQTRHTFATIAFSSGESLLWIAKTMGHRDAEMVIKVYSKYIENINGTEDGTIMDRMYRVFEGKMK